MKTEDLEKNFYELENLVLDFYHEKVTDFINNHIAELSDGELSCFIMNMCIGLASNVYLSIKRFMPGATFDFDFMKAKMINELRSEFDRIKDFNPLMQTIINPDQFEKLNQNGEIEVTLENGKTVKVTNDKIYLRDDINGHDPEKIISPHNETIQ